MIRITDLMWLTGYKRTACQAIVRKIKARNNRTDSSALISVKEFCEYFNETADNVVNMLVARRKEHEQW